ncbi:G-patch and R3H domain-containing protein c [Diplocarpon rosae]|nr:G-patch and R3H domain-containing protein c [Diplocarpon rosae]
MPKPKRAWKRGNFQAASRGGRRAANASFVPFEGTSTPQRGHGFTLQDEARNIERHSSFWNTDQRLRDSKVSFVSAGKFEPTKLEVNEAALADMSLESRNPHHEDETAEAEEEDMEQQQTEVFGDFAESPIMPPAEDNIFNFIVDTRGSEPVHTGLASPRIRSVSPTPSNSSEEIILFRGRNQKVTEPLKPFPKSTPVPAPRAYSDPIDTKIRIVEDRIESLKEALHPSEHCSVLQSPTMHNNASYETIRPKYSKGRISRSRRKKRSVEKEEEDETIADYIANMDEHDSVFASFNHRDLRGPENEAWQDTEVSSGEVVGESSEAFQSGWNRSEIEDLDELSTSDGVMGDVQAILSKRQRVSGTQYLVVWENQSTDEARWVPLTTLTSVTALVHVESFEAEEKLVAEFKDNRVDDTVDSDESNLHGEYNDEDDEDDKDTIQRKNDRMSDEKIARLLSKQEELGMGSDDILLLEAYGDEDDYGNMEMSFSKSAYHSTMPMSKQVKDPCGPSRTHGDFLSATLLADAYEGFDVMDHDRPSLQRKSKGRKCKNSFGNSDSELEASMQMTHANDRLKKKKRKQEREELRAQGLLGSKDGKVDMKQKYQEGMGIHSVKEEIKNFLVGGNTTLSLPPMDKAYRKIVHEFAQAFNLKSKSAGNGNQRFPILYRTNKTRVFNASAFHAVDAKISRRFLPRMDIRAPRVSSGKRSGAGTGGGFNSAAVSYRDGDIVGGSAPELGAENKGRAMLEKMGWLSGEALGAFNNKGILQPVSHVVKTGKAGLG